jgi:hypothetical protein
MCRIVLKEGNNWQAGERIAGEGNEEESGE